jgi:hypothetical protein
MIGKGIQRMWFHGRHIKAEGKIETQGEIEKYAC